MTLQVAMATEGQPQCTDTAPSNEHQDGAEKAMVEEKLLQPLPRRFKRVWSELFPNQPVTDSSFVLFVSYRTPVAMSLYNGEVQQARAKIDGLFARDAQRFKDMVNAEKFDFIS